MLFIAHSFLCLNSAWAFFLSRVAFVLPEVDYCTSLCMCGSNGCYECVEILTLVTLNTMASGELCSSIWSPPPLFICSTWSALSLCLSRLLLLPALSEIAQQVLSRYSLVGSGFYAVPSAEPMSPPFYFCPQVDTLEARCTLICMLPQRLWTADVQLWYFSVPLFWGVMYR